MTTVREVETLASRLMARGAWVALTYDPKAATRRVLTVVVVGAKGIESRRMMPADAVRKMRTWLEQHAPEAVA
jgi:hypothetical protein